MNELPKNYDPAEIEGNIFEAWTKAGYFERGSRGAGVAAHAQEAAPYTIVIPPPNVTGVLHMGHALNDTLQDICVRRARMQGRNTRWIVGTDHAGIATQNKVEQKLAKEGKTRFDLGREAFVDECWKWRDEHGSVIIEQLKRMGCSCDFDDEKFTMSPEYQQTIRHVFCDWYHAGLIYRGHRIINWCPRCGTALADDEVEHEDEDGHLWHLRYPLKTPVDGIEYVTVATTRPETMLGDTAVAVNPDDERYKNLVGATVVLPLVGREIPIIADEYVDREFGTGFVKMTPAHDPNDFEVGLRHNLEQINVFTPDAHIVEGYGDLSGMDRFEARDAIVARFDELGLLDHVEGHAHAVGHCYRCHTTIEPWLSDQWFVSMKPLAAPAIEAVRDGRVRFNAERWNKVYFSWMENIRDWCISRQLWWGHRIPVFHCDSCGWEDALEEDVDVCPKCGGHVHQDEDVLDTWFSSQLWPFATMGWLQGGQKEAELAYYPTQVLSTARDIIFLWVARMVMSSMYFMDGQVPFHEVIIHPTVLDAKGRRMSKSLGNGIDPIKLIDEYGADGMRFGLALQVTGSQDMKFNDKKLASSRNFATKIWNAARFVLMNLDGFELGDPQADEPADRWILSRLATLAAAYDHCLETYEFGEATRLIYSFFWSEFCDWYIELCKPRLAQEGPARLTAQRNLVFVLDQALRLLHPIMPFVTEEIWDQLPHEDEAPSLMVAAWPDIEGLQRFLDEDAEHRMLLVTDVITCVRSTRARYQLSPHVELPVVVRAASEEDAAILHELSGLVEGMARTSGLSIALDAQKPAGSSAQLVDGMEVYVVLEGLVDFEAERARLSKDREKATSDLDRVQRKLANPGFLAKAAADIIEKDRAKADDLTETLRIIDEQLRGLE